MRRALDNWRSSKTCSGGVHGNRDWVRKRSRQTGMTQPDNFSWNYRQFAKTGEAKQLGDEVTHIDLAFTRSSSGTATRSFED
jgi:hypothetical protein